MGGLNTLVKGVGWGGVGVVGGLNTLVKGVGWGGGGGCGWVEHF